LRLRLGLGGWLGLRLRLGRWLGLRSGTILRGSTDVDGESVNSTGGNGTGGVLVAIRVDVVVGERVALAVNLVLVHDTAVVVGGILEVVVLGLEGRGGITVFTQESGAGEGSAETGDDSQVDIVVSLLLSEGAAVASPDVTGSRLSVATVVAIAVHHVAADLAVDVAGTHLGVEDKGLAAVGLPDLVDVRLPVLLERLGVDGRELVVRENSDGTAELVVDAEISPRVAIGVSLCLEVLADVVDSGGGQTVGNLSWAAVGNAELHSENQTDEIDVADVGVEDKVLGVSELHEAPVEGGAGIREVAERGLDETVTGAGEDHEECEVALAEVDTGGGNGDGKVDLEGLTLGRQGNGDILLDLDWLGGASGAWVEEASVRSQEDDTAVRV
jgi:hypothetical protein